MQFMDYSKILHYYKQHNTYSIHMELNCNPVLEWWFVFQSTVFLKRFTHNAKRERWLWCHRPGMGEYSWVNAWVLAMEYWTAMQMSCSQWMNCVLESKNVKCMFQTNSWSVRFPVSKNSVLILRLGMSARKVNVVQLSNPGHPVTDTATWCIEDNHL